MEFPDCLPYSRRGTGGAKRAAPKLMTRAAPASNIHAMLSSIGRAEGSVPRSPVEVERAVRRELYGDRPTVGLTRTRRRPLDAREAEPLGQLFGGRYRVLERVGTGGMATVYRARDERLARNVAVKVMRERLARDPQLVRRFRREAQICGRLAHPNIVAVLDAAAVPRDFISWSSSTGPTPGPSSSRKVGRALARRLTSSPRSRTRSATCMTRASSTRTSRPTTS